MKQYLIFEVKTDKKTKEDYIDNPVKLTGVYQIKPNKRRVK